MEYRNNRSHYRWLKLFLICIIIVALGTVVFFAYLIPRNPIISKPSTPVEISTSTPTTTLPTPPKISTTTASAQTLNYNFGIAFGDTLPWLTVPQLDARLDDLVSLHIGWIRFDMAWDDVQQNNSSTFNWTNLDRVIAAAKARNIKVLPDLGYTPAWAAPADCSDKTDGKCAPADPAQFAAFAKAAVTRYAPQGVSDWEIWNEPNNAGFWQPAPSATAYAALLKDAYGAIKSVQPSAVVITAGLAPELSTDGNIAPLAFLSELYAAGAEPYFNAVGFHPYSFPALPSNYQGWNAWSQMSETDPSLRSIMIANGDASKKIWMTEFGAPTDGPGNLATDGTLSNWPNNPDHVSEALQAQMFSTAITLAQNSSWAGPLFFYSYQDLGTSTQTRENFFGIVRFDGTDKPAYTTIKSMLAE